MCYSFPCLLSPICIDTNKRYFNWLGLGYFKVLVAKIGVVPTLTPYSNAPPPSKIGKNKLEEIAITVAMLLPKKSFLQLFSQLTVISQVGL